MNMHVTARDVRTLAEQIANRKAVRERLMNPPRRVYLPQTTKVELQARAKQHRFLPDQDAHVRAYWKHLSDCGSPVRTYIRRRANELGLSHEEICRKVRLRRIVHARQLVMWEVKTIVAPDISYPELARLFGGFDHTTALHAVQKMQAMKDKGEL